MRNDTWDRLTGSGCEARAAAWSAVRILAAAAVLAALLYGAYRVFVLRWVADDAFISFRYAQNLVAGDGLVFNVGERVEGYTNFLWTLLIALGMKLHLDPVPLTQALGGLSYVATAGTLARLSARLGGPGKERARLFFPTAALAFLLHHDVQVWATGGLETMGVTALVVAGYACLVPATSRRWHLIAGLLFVAAALTRPDALLFYLAALLYLVIAGHTSKRNVLAFAFPLGFVFVPYWVLRYSYYGFVFPNTYYAKSAGIANYAQGLAYLGLYVRSYYVFCLVPVAAVHLIWRRRARLFRRPEAPADRAAGLALLFCLVCAFYVVRVGGDFMFARFLIPVTPFALLLLECSIRRTVRSWRLWCVLSLLLVAAVVARRDPFIEPRSLIEGVADEHAWYPEAWRQDRQEFGRTLRRCLAATDARLAFMGTHAATVFYAGPLYAVESDAGLTDTALAHRPLITRGRPGHEKRAAIEDLVERKVHFLLRLPRTDPTPIDRLTEIRFGCRSAYIVTYDAELMAHLKQFGDVTFIDFPTYLDRYVTELDARPGGEVVAMYRFARAYYFDHNEDSARAAAFTSRLAKSDPAD